jgi:hypothetical protein
VLSDGTERAGLIFNGQKVHWTLWALKLALQLQTSGTNHSVTRRQIPKELRAQLYLYESVKNRIKNVFDTERRGLMADTRNNSNQQQNGLKISK